MKVGIIRNLSLGDSIVFSPFINILNKELNLKEITIFSGAGLSYEYFSRLREIGLVQNVVKLDIKYSILKKILIVLKYFKRYDLLIDTIQGTKLTSFLCNVWSKSSLGFKNFGYYKNNFYLDELDKNLFILEKDLKLLSYFGKISFDKNDFELIFPLLKKDYSELEKKIKNYNFDLSSNYIVLHPSSKITYKSRKLENFKWDSIIDYILGKGYKVILIGSKDDEEIIGDIKNKDGLYKFHNLDLSIWETGCLINKSKFYIGINSGPMWISVALKKESIVLNGPTANDWVPPNKYYSYIHNIRGVYKEGECYKNPCDKETCKYNENGIGLCMKNISVENIINTINIILEKERV
ncbi:MAG: glycosyltransferase family 9 protein [Candidatus Gracilibacteria bacterium]|nr:glycosyltransferase family 9 protein [Candidatus Gracilibacteria bacterium]